MNATNATFAGRNSSRTQGRALRKLRFQVAAAFRDAESGVSEQEAGSRTRDFYRSSGADWARNLD